MKISCSTTASFSGGRVDQNIAHNNHCTGLWTDSNPAQTNNVVTQPCASGDNWFTRNYCFANDRNGIQSEIIERGLVCGNLLVGNGGDGLKIPSNPGQRIWHNTFVGNGWSPLNVTSYVDGTSGKWWTDVPQASSWQQVVCWVDSRYSTWSHTNPPVAGPYSGVTLSPAPGDIRNNIFFDTNPSAVSGTRTLRAANQNATYSKAGTAIIGAQDYNAYFRATANSPTNLISYVASGTTSQTVYTTLANFIAGLGAGREANGVEGNGVGIGTIFTNSTLGDYSVVASSTADRNGAALPQDVADALSKTNATQYKIGADVTGLLVSAFI
jgi:hypothetical protein